jgi:hypothetical protein
VVVVDVVREVLDGVLGGHAEGGSDNFGVHDGDELGEAGDAPQAGVGPGRVKDVGEIGRRGGLAACPAATSSSLLGSPGSTLVTTMPPRESTSGAQAGNGQAAAAIRSGEQVPTQLDSTRSFPRRSPPRQSTGCPITPTSPSPPATATGSPKPSPAEASTHSVTARCSVLGGCEHLNG